MRYNVFTNVEVSNWQIINYTQSWDTVGIFLWLESFKKLRKVIVPLGLYQTYVLWTSVCEAGVDHLVNILGLNNNAKVVRNCRLIEQYKIKFMAPFRSANMSITSPNK